MIVAGATAFPTAMPSLLDGMRQNPLAPLLVAAVWLVATAASIAGKRFISAGHMGWAETATAHVGGTVANRVIPAGMGTTGAFIAAMRRGGASTATAAGSVALWSAGGGVAHAIGLVLGLAWIQGGGEALIIAVAAVAVIIVTAPQVARRARVMVQAIPARWRASVRPAGRPPRTMLKQAVRSRVHCAVSTVRDVVSAARTRPIRAAAALVAQFIAMLCMATGFALVAASFGLPVTTAAGMAAYVGGTALAATTPTPAGIGGAEAALVGALVLVGASASEALPAVLLFRAVVLLAPVAVAALMAAAWPALRWLAGRGQLAPLPVAQVQELR